MQGLFILSVFMNTAGISAWSVVKKDELTREAGTGAATVTELGADPLGRRPSIMVSASWVVQEGARTVSKG